MVLEDPGAQNVTGSKVKRPCLKRFSGTNTKRQKATAGDVNSQNKISENHKLVTKRGKQLQKKRPHKNTNQRK